MGRLKYLVDTNVWLSVLLTKDKTDAARKFFQSVPAEQVAITEFSLYSIGIILIRLKKPKLFLDFIEDVLEDSAVKVLRLELAELKRLLRVQKQFQLDFDDAYQLVAAGKCKLTLVSYDQDFDRTEPGRKTPEELVKDG